MESNRIHDSVDEKHVEFWSKMMNGWWDEHGRLHVLHEMNKVRVPFVHEGLVRNGTVREGDIVSRSNVHILDVGCGGGILAESLAKMGYRVTGIDPSEELVSVGKKHAELVKGSYGELKLDYDATSIEQLAEEMPGKYDAVVASEVVEHVTDPESFIQGCVKSLKPGGSLFISTINRTFLSWFVFIFLFEYIFNVIPLGTHLWSKFITPKEIEDQLKEVGCRVVKIKGLFYVPVKRKWYWVPTLSVCYAMHAVKD